MSNPKGTDKELFYDRFSGEWEDRINRNETFKRINVVFDKLLKPSELIGKDFLEVGCGLGYFSNKASSFGARVTAIDIGPNLVELSRKKTPKAKFLTASASDLPFENETFDIVLSTEVIEHVERQDLAIREMCRVLRIGGILVITTPNKVFKPLFDFLNLLRVRPYRGNENWFYSSTLKNLFLKENMKLVKEYYFNFFYPNSFLDKFENRLITRFFCINFAFKFKKV